MPGINAGGAEWRTVPWRTSWSAFALLLLSLWLPGQSFAVALPEPVREAAPDLRLAGEGRLRWFGLLIYDAALWTRGDGFRRDGEFALTIRYARNLSAARIIETSVEEMRRLGWNDEAALARWSQAMRRIFPDVGKGEQLTGLNLPGVGVDFFYNRRFAGRIADPEFGPAFFSIWLDPRTREPGLRESLIERQ